MHGELLAAVIRTVGDGMSRRSVMRNGLGGLAALARGRLIGTSVSAPLLPSHHTFHDETASEACYRLCTSDATHLLTPEREQRCWVGCDLWAEEAEFM